MKEPIDAVSMPNSEDDGSPQTSQHEKASVFEENKTQQEPDLSPPQSEKVFPVMELPQSDNSMEANRFEVMLRPKAEPKDSFLSLDSYQQDGGESLPKEVLQQVIEDLNPKFQELILVWFEADNLFRAQVSVICASELVAEQKAQLIIDLLETLLDERRSNTQDASEFRRFNETLLLIRRYRYVFERQAHKNGMEEMNRLLHEARQGNERLIEDIRQLNPIESGESEHMSVSGSLFFNRRGSIAVKGILFLGLFGLALTLLTLGLAELAAIVFGLALGQFLAEVFAAISRSYGGE